MSAASRHNAVVGSLLQQIVQPPIAAGDGTSAVLAILESVAAGVLTACAGIDGWDNRQRDAMLMTLESGIRTRLEELPASGGKGPRT